MILKHANRFHDKEIIGTFFEHATHYTTSYYLHWEDRDNWEDNWGVEATYELEFLEINTADMDGQPISPTNRQTFSRSLL
jgi:hypothetical protein